MKEQNTEVFEKARRFVYRNARPLDLARWKYHFESGSSREVLTALAAYQNADGGFGYGLEEDNMNPNSSPMQVWRATVVLREMNNLCKTEPIITRILHYLEQTPEFDGKKWNNVIATNNDWPHAPWWSYSSVSDEQSTEEGRFCDWYNPTASLAGFLLRYANADSDIYKKALTIVKEAIETLFRIDNPQDMHVIACLIQMCEDIAAAGLGECFELERLTAHLQKLVAGMITQDVTQWETSYACKPSQFFCEKDSLFYQGNENLAQYECEFIRKTQMPDGAYTVPWSWDAYPEEWAVSRNFWRAEITVKNMIYLDNMDGES